MLRPERWIPLLRECDDEIKVLKVLNDFVQTIPPADLAKLPVAAALGAFDSLASVGNLAVTLAREELLFDGDGHSQELMHAVTQVFGAASMRLVELQSRKVDVA